MKKLLLFFTAFFLFSVFTISAHAEGITYLGSEITLYDNTAHIMLTITFDSSDVSRIRIPFFNSVQNLKSKSNFGSEKCSAEKRNYGYDIVCDIKPTPEKRMLELEFDSFDIITHMESQMMFNSEFYVPLNTKTLYLKVLLPEGMVLAENSTTFGAYTPSTGEKGSDGRRIYIYWKEDNLSAGESFNSRIFYESLKTEDDFLLIGMVLAFIAIISIAGVIVFAIKKMKAGMNVVLPILRKDEKILMELIVKHKGAISQKILVLESNYSKAKVSKVLSSLQERGLVKTEHAGRSNKVYLSEEYKNAKIDKVRKKSSIFSKVRKKYRK